MTWEMREDGRFNDLLGKVRVRSEGEGRARCRLFTDKSHSNLNNVLHGGAILGFIDIALFSSSRAMGTSDPGSAVTLDASVQFIAPGRMNEPLDAVVELLRETGRMIFLRGVVEQGDHKVAAFSGTLRKASGRS